MEGKEIDHKKQNFPDKKKKKGQHAEEGKRDRVRGKEGRGEREKKS